ncbi:unnamed protein product [Tuber aestivum]|uniref:Uncharacterized protein n=1 Tax=Tuber aestivum TaxID=59557 RepID=A0A292PQF1_9PEZI|nr:unnamed protein product [Tuber aestivum]
MIAARPNPAGAITMLTLDNHEHDLSASNRSALLANKDMGTTECSIQCGGSIDQSNVTPAVLPQQQQQQKHARRGKHDVETHILFFHSSSFYLMATGHAIVPNQSPKVKVCLCIFFQENALERKQGSELSSLNSKPQPSTVSHKQIADDGGKAVCPLGPNSRVPINYFSPLLSFVFPTKCLQ